MHHTCSNLHHYFTQQKFTLEQAIKAYGGRCIVVLFL